MSVGPGTEISSVFTCNYGNIPIIMSFDEEFRLYKLRLGHRVAIG